jgi:hypothetical protein
VREPLAIVRQSLAGAALPFSSASLFFLSQQSFGYGPRPKRSRSATRAGLVGYRFETAHNAIAPIWQPGACICPRELGSVVEGAHSNDGRKPNGWLEQEICHVAEALSR